MQARILRLLMRLRHAARREQFTDGDKKTLNLRISVVDTRSSSGQRR